MTKRRSTWLGGTGALFLILSLSGVAAGATPPDAVPDVVVDTTASYEDIDGNGIDDDCQDVEAVADEDAAAAELLTVDADANGVISTTEAAHSDRIGGKNCNHGGYVSWIAHQDVSCEDEPTEPVTEPAVELIVAQDEDGDADGDDEVAEPEDEPETDACAEADASGAEAAKAEKAAAAALRAVLKAERKAARDTAKAERTAARDAAKAEQTSARDAKKAERTAAHAAAKAERAAARAARTKKGH
jgi:hypothetical protein